MKSGRITALLVLALLLAGCTFTVTTTADDIKALSALTGFSK